MPRKSFQCRASFGATLLLCNGLERNAACEAMPIGVDLDAVLRARGMSLTELSERVGLTLANLSILKTGKAKAIRFSTLDAICRALSCQPADLLHFEPDKD